MTPILAQKRDLGMDMDTGVGWGPMWVKPGITKREAGTDEETCVSRITNSSEQENVWGEMTCEGCNEFMLR